MCPDKLKIGILGGMGPGASCNLYSKMIDICQKKYSAVQDTDYPEMIIYSIGLEGFDETGIVDAKLVLNQLVKGIGLLNNAGADFIVMACNTVHCFIDELREISKAPILSIVEETAKQVKKAKVSSVALLASETTYKMKLYDSVFENHGVKFSVPDNKQVPTKAILEVMSGNVSEKTKDELLFLINSFDTGAIVLGCTELPLAVSQKDTPIKVFDSLHILAESALEKCYNVMTVKNYTS
jgi:aspartate racemase